MKILVSGGGGFIGSHLSERLLEEGHEVVIVDNFFSGQRMNVEHLLDNPKFTLVEHDITEPLPESKIHGLDRVYHLACPASPIYYQHDPVKTVQTNVLGTIHCLEIALKNKARYLITSTSEVYGNPLVHPQPEGYWGNVSTLGPRACYDEGKRVAETLTMEYHRQKGLDVRITRIFNTYGPRLKVNDGRVVSNFVMQALEGDQITVYGDGSQTRSFCFVSDTVRGLMTQMENEEVGAYPVNIGNPTELTVLQLAQKIGQIIGHTEIVFKGLPKDDPVRRKPDISRAKSVLNWEPTIDLEQGLDLSIQYFRDLIEKQKEKN